MGTAETIANMVTETGGHTGQARPTPVASLSPLAQLFTVLLAAVEDEIAEWPEWGQLVYVCDTLNSVGEPFSYQTMLDAWALWEHAAGKTGIDETGLGWWPQTERGMECRIAAIKEAIRLASQGWTP